MPKKSVAILLIGLLAMIALSACGNLSPSAQATSTPAPTIAPTVVPKIANSPTPQAKQSAPATPVNPQREQALKYLEDALKGTGWMGGTVASVSGNSIDLRSLQGATKIDVPMNAIIVVPNKTSASVADIQRGDRLVIDTVSDTDRTIQLVLDFPSHYKSENLMMAVVQTVRGNTLMLRDRTGVRQTNLSAATAIVNMTSDTPILGSSADLKTAAVVLAMGDSVGDSFNAQVILLLDKDIRNLLQPNAPAPSPTTTKKP